MFKGARIGRRRFKWRRTVQHRFFPNYSFSPLSRKIRCYPRSFVVRVTRSWKMETIRPGITETLSGSSLNDNGQGTPGTLKSSLLLSINN